MSEQTMMEKKLSDVILSRHPAKESDVEQWGNVLFNRRQFSGAPGKVKRDCGKVPGCEPFRIALLSLF